MIVIGYKTVTNKNISGLPSQVFLRPIQANIRKGVTKNLKIIKKLREKREK